jgi:SRSO17 transposase
LPEIAKAVEINSAQSLHHFIAKLPGSATKIRSRRFHDLIQVMNQFQPYFPDG